jgi:hypothetical protein
MAAFVLWQKADHPASPGPLGRGSASWGEAAARPPLPSLASECALCKNMREARRKSGPLSIFGEAVEACAEIIRYSRSCGRAGAIAMSEFGPEDMKRKYRRTDDFPCRRYCSLGANLAGADDPLLE